MSAVELAYHAGVAREDGTAAGAAVQADEELIGLMDRHERPLYRYLLALLRDQDAALDCAQDAFMRAYENLRGGRPVNSQWLYKVARNRATDEFRRRRRVEPGAQTLERAPVHAQFEVAVDVQSAMHGLSPMYREALYLFEVAGFKTEEIGAMLGLQGTAVRQRLYRARERFRQLYTGSR